MCLCVMNGVWQIKGCWEKSEKDVKLLNAGEQRGI